MNARLKQYFVYLGGSLSALLTIYSVALSAGVLPGDWQKTSFVILITLAATICAVLVWLDAGNDSAGGRRAGAETTDYFDSFQRFKQSLTEVHIARRDDEAVALKANQLVRDQLDAHCISYEDYRVWRAKNRAISTVILDRDHKIVGIFDIFPIQDSTAAALHSGRKREHELSVDDIVPEHQNDEASCIYIASVLVNRERTQIGRQMAVPVVMHFMFDHLFSQFPPREGRSLLAFAHTKEGVRFLEKYGFHTKLLPAQTTQGDALYALPDVDYAALYEERKILIQELNHARRFGDVARLEGSRLRTARGLRTG